MHYKVFWVIYMVHTSQLQQYRKCRGCGDSQFLCMKLYQNATVYKKSISLKIVEQLRKNQESVS